MPQNLTNKKSVLALVMAWCHQAASYYMSQCSPRYMSLHGVTRPQWVNWTIYRLFCFTSLASGRCGTNEKSTFIHVMACCCQTTSHYLSQCWPRTMVSYVTTSPQWVKHIISKLLWIDILKTSHEIALMWIPQSTLVHVMAWCHQATSHYLSQCWPRSMSPIFLANFKSC